MTQHRSIFVDSALSIVKGAACIVFQIPVGRTTKSVSFKPTHSGILSLSQVTKPPTNDQIEHLKFLVNNKISEDAKYKSYLIQREIAEKLYGDSMYDAFNVPQDVKSLRVIILEEWNINCNAFPILQSTRFLGKIEIGPIKFLKAKEQLDIKFEVYPDITDMSVIPICVDQTVDIDKLPQKSKVLPQLGNDNTFISDDSNEQQTINPWKVEAKSGFIDYDKIINSFGCSRIEDHHIRRFEKLTGRKAHHFLTRKIFFSHRDLDTILDSYENGNSFYLYTGRGPSSESLHLGHLIPFLFTKYLQEVFNVLVIIQLTDDEKYLFRDDLDISEIQKLAFENTKDIIACGFDPNKTFIFTDSGYIKELYPTVLKVQKRITLNQSKAIFGFNDSDNIGKVAFGAVQASPSFSCTFPNLFKQKPNIRCLIPQAIDQDPYFRMTRDVAPRIKQLKPSLIHSVFFPSLQGPLSKMSSSLDSSAIFLTDSSADIARKIKKFAFSGGKQTLEEQQEKGADLTIDIPYNYLKFFMEDDAQYENIGIKYASGKMLTSEVKDILINVLQKVISEHQEKRKKLTDEDVILFMDPSRSTLQC